ncbi:class I SAM-dependent methyltransferase [Streptomyces marincola]|uniref:Methyltransferase domain-containing protein n=1 Tax=Streptomyces marincola TaxID=2878388 RepID=A0A1W7D032_9ACTN|nr:class I SAM-dependent methyltransferase [Streptomyces marincola]ARQ70404.1 hypothetical protein CAG99_17545 [Streptomyces marincola]
MHAHHDGHAAGAPDGAQGTHTPHGHGHGHGHDTEMDWEAMGDRLERQAGLEAGAMAEAVSWLAGRVPGARRVLDVGSGPGGAALLFAERLPEAEVVAVDGTEALLARARAGAAARGVAGRLVTRRAELPEALGELGAADLIWSARFVHHLGDQRAALAGLAKLLRPGGVLAVVEGGLPARYLPRDIGVGRPGLVTRLDAAEEEWFAAMRGDLPGHAEAVEDWPEMLRQAGLAGAASRSFLVDLPAPLGDAARAHVHDRLSRMRQAGARPDASGAAPLSAEDRDALGVLLDPESPLGILTRPDAFYLSAFTVHTARRPA